MVRARTLLAIVVTLGLSGMARADIVTLRDGKTVEGIVRVETSTTIVIEVYKDDPTRQTYHVDENNRFTAASRERWFSCSKRCYDHLGNCDRALRDIAKIAEQYPIFKPAAEEIESFREKIKALRDSIKRYADRRGI